MYGLTTETIRKLKKAFGDIPKIEKVILYGSRAKGNYRNGSDVDITLVGENLNLKNTVYPLMDRLDELNQPYTFDISIFNNLNNSALIEHIQRVGKVLYLRS